MPKIKKESFVTFSSDGISFTSHQAADIRTMYVPLCSVDATGLKSAITPFLSGDIKLDKSHYVTKPSSREDLRYASRNFYVRTDKKKTFSLTQESASHSAHVEIGQLWHQLTRVHKKAGLLLTALNFIPVSNETVELMQVSVTNISKKAVSFTPTFAVPIFGRSLSNKHDHEHVTALLNRVVQVDDGVFVEPTMVFNEEGHKQVHALYFVLGKEGQGASIVGTFPTVDSFIGDGATMDAPYAVVESVKPRRLSSHEADGKEAVGALRFKEQSLAPGQSKSYVMAIGIAADSKEAAKIFTRFDSSLKFEKALEANKRFWREKVSSLDFKTGDPSFNAWMRWVTLQPVLRRIFGCSFLPDHDYGKGGKGWRDLWQDLLSLILIEPQHVGEQLFNNCAGIRIDGSNATIIGAKFGEFIADRNAITRVWMDHGCWPLLTILLYIHQTGNFDLLLKRQAYFRDPQLSRTFEKDLAWSNSYGNKLLDKKGHVYEGTILEHLLVQNLTQFFNVGEHNMIRLESADWNDGLDMAFAKGESVAFSAFYAGNLLQLATLLEDMAKVKGIKTIHLAKEVLILLDTIGKKSVSARGGFAFGVNYDHYKEKHAHLFGHYFNTVQPVISGETVDVDIKDVVHDLRAKAHWLFGHIRSTEKVTVEQGGQVYQWFNGYYDNQAKRVEGNVGNTIRMTLTGQVFALMSGCAQQEEIPQVIESVAKFLRDKKLGGYRLNTDFGLRHYLDLGRAFGFAYGTKENGAFFSHMNVMYAYALYSRGFAREGFEVLNSIYKMASDGNKAKIYPGIPEYFDSQGRGMYHFLTGSASWMVLTQLTQSFGVRGHYGDLLLAPQLVKEQFDAKGNAQVSVQFAGKSIDFIYHNPRQLDAGAYRIKEVLSFDKPMAFNRNEKGQVLIARHQIRSDLSLKLLLDA